MGTKQSKASQINVQINILKAKKALYTVGEQIVQSAWPLHCPVCRRIVEPDWHLLICPLCRETLEYVTEPVCLKCGKPIGSGKNRLCADCIRQKREENGYFDRGVAVFHYGSVRDGLLDLKYKNKREYAAFFATEAVRTCGHLICERWKADALIPIPVHRTRARTRGYNQAQLLAVKMGQQLQLPVRSDILIRQKSTVAQKKLNDIERQKNLQGAFTVAGDVSGLRSVVLIDDVYTTGSTMEANARVLKEAGVQKVFYVAMAIGQSTENTDFPIP